MIKILYIFVLLSCLLPMASPCDSSSNAEHRPVLKRGGLLGGGGLDYPPGVLNYEDGE